MLPLHCEINYRHHAVVGLAFSACLSFSACKSGLSGDDESNNEGGWGGEENSARDNGEDEESRVFAPLLELSPTKENLDPLSKHRPEIVDCNNLGGWFLENEVLEVNTGKCNYLSLSELSRTSATSGDWLLTTLTHFDLTAPMPTDAHVALIVGDDLVWEKEIQIPAAGDVIKIRVQLISDVEAGTPVVFHLHNHGQNTWQLAQIFVRSTPGED